MSQNSLTLPTTGTVSGLTMTQNTNNALDTLNTLASGPSAPSSPEAGQLWHDTTNNVLKIRSLDAMSWIPLLALNESAYTAGLPAGTTGSTPSIGNNNTLVPTTAFCKTAPTYTALTSGTGATYTPPVGVAWLRVRQSGGGGGGGGAGGTSSNGGNGSTTTFGSTTTLGGSGGVAATGGVNTLVGGGSGGSGGTTGTGEEVLRVAGQAGGAGQAYNSNYVSGQPGDGGSTPFGYGGRGRQYSIGFNAATTSGAGGAGAGSASVSGASGGGAGEYVKYVIASPAASYTYTIGGGGNDGGGSNAGGSGAAGFIGIEEYYIG